MKIKGHLDLFSGIGGFALGLEQAGVEPEWTGFSDIDPYANKLFKRRFKDAEELGTITDVSYRSLGGKRIDLLTGGFPCQAFSVAGLRNGFSDSRGTLFFEIERILQDYIDNGKPIPCFLLENVKGLLNHDNGRTFATIYGILTNLNYSVECQLVNTKWWLPQNRERIYIFGRYNGNPSGRKVFPIGKNDIEVNDVQGQYTNTITARYEAGATGSYVIESKFNAQKEEKLKRGKKLEIRDDDVANTITSHQLDSIIKVKKDYKILDDYNNKIKEDGICGTITQHCSRSARKNGMKVIENDSRIRRLTPIECERLQGFPDNWTDGQSDTQRYKQCGNAVSVPVTKAIFKKIYKDKNEKQRNG